jgi:dsRNA-specific ribonuclease
MTFTHFIEALLLSFSLEPRVMEVLTRLHSINSYSRAFTHLRTEHIENYESFEQIGDAVLKTFMATYFYKRFPILWERTHGVKIVARLMIKYGSGAILSTIAEKYDFWPHIRLPPQEETKRMAIQEDVVEAFIGATFVILDTAFQTVGAGFVVTYNILGQMFDSMDISLEYRDLFDAKTRLKELCDMYKSRIGSIVYNCRRTPQGIECTLLHNAKPIAQETLATKSAAEQAVAAVGLELLKREGFSKPVPAEYEETIRECTNK